MSRPIKIGLLAEGKTELGLSVNHIDPQNGGKAINRDEEGALHTLIRRELEQIGIEDCSFIHRHPTASERQIGKLKADHTISNPSYLSQTIIAWQAKEVDLIVIVIDSDGNIEGRQQAIQRALQTIQENHLDENEEVITDQSVGGLAIKNFETWLIADPEAVENLLGVTLDQNPEDLESLPADKKASDFAKNILERAITLSTYEADSGNNRPWLIRWHLAERLDCQKIKDRCPQGYVPFINDLTETANSVAERISQST